MHHCIGPTLHVPVWGTLQPASLVIAIGNMTALMRFKIGAIPTLLSSGLAGMVHYLTAIVE